VTPPDHPNVIKENPVMVSAGEQMEVWKDPDAYMSDLKSMLETVEAMGNTFDMMAKRVQAVEHRIGPGVHSLGQAVEHRISVIESKVDQLVALADSLDKNIMAMQSAFENCYKYGEGRVYATLEPNPKFDQ
jgi:hypothetical protein